MPPVAATRSAARYLDDVGPVRGHDSSRPYSVDPVAARLIAPGAGVAQWQGPRSLALIAALPLSLALAAWLAGVRVSRFVVRGPSMAPALLDGDRLLVLCLAPWAMRPRPGAIVIARPRALDGAEIVKRVAGVEHERGRRRYALLGDNPSASTDSRTFGDISPSELTGIAFLRYWPDARRGRLPSPVEDQPRGSETRPSSSVTSWSRANPSSSPVSQGRSGGP